jgi:hypothetical protein
MATGWDVIRLLSHRRQLFVANEALEHQPDPLCYPNLCRLAIHEVTTAGSRASASLLFLLKLLPCSEQLHLPAAYDPVTERSRR